MVILISLVLIGVIIFISRQKFPIIQKCILIKYQLCTKQEIEKGLHQSKKRVSLSYAAMFLLPIPLSFIFVSIERAIDTKVLTLIFGYFHVIFWIFLIKYWEISGTVLKSLQEKTGGNKYTQ